MKDKTNSELATEADRHEQFAEWGAIAVVAGLVLEIVLVANLGDDPVWGKWTTVFANFVIALGVGAEVLFGRKASEGFKELQHRAELELAKTKGDVQQAMLIANSPRTRIL